MANSTDVHNHCLTPFLPEAAYKSFAGSTAARWCKDMSISKTETASCCLPCPALRWRYSEGLEDGVNNASWSAIPILILVLFVLASHIFLPSQATGQHFITTSATFGFIFFQLAWIIPLQSEPEVCRDDITAHDLRSDLRCAFSGASILFGVWIVILSCLCGATFLHITVCWERTLGRKFKIISLIGIYGGSAAMLALVLSVSGVSYQFAKTCAPNPHKSKASLWGPLIGFAGVTLLIEVATVGYCVYVIVKPLYQDWRRSDFQGSSTPSSFYSGRTIPALSASSRVRRILQLQWKLIAVVCLVLFHVALICGVFIQLVNLYEAPMEDLLEWLSCLSLHERQKECASSASGMGPDQNFFLGVLLLLMVCPFWDFVVLIHRSVFTAWLDLFKGRNPADNPTLPARGTPLVGGLPNRKAVGQRDNTSRNLESPAASSLDDMGPKVLTSQKIEGWQSTSPERPYTSPKQSFSAPLSPRVVNRDERGESHHAHSSSGGYSVYSPTPPLQWDNR